MTKDPVQKNKPRKFVETATKVSSQNWEHRGRGERGDKTTLNMQNPTGEGAEMAPPDALGEALVSQGVISRHQLFNALNESYHRECTLKEALVDLGYLDAETLAKMS